MTDAQSTSAQGSAGISSSSSSSSSSTTPPVQRGGSSTSSSSWIPPIPRPLQRVFDAVPLLTYSANELPYRSPASVDSSLPTLHIFTSEQDAAKGWPSFNPSCLKWQTYLRVSGISHNLTPSTNHASPTGSLPFLLPALPSVPDQRLDTRPLLPIPSSRLGAYAERHNQPPHKTRKDDSDSPGQSTSHDAQQKETSDGAPHASKTSAHRQQAYQSLLDTPIRNAWLYTLYLSPPNGPLLHRLYLRPVSRSSLVQKSILSQLRRAARAEIAKATNTPTPTPPKSESKSKSTSSSWSVSFGGGDASPLTDLLTWAAVGGQPTIDPEIIYAEAKKAFEALEAALFLPTTTTTTTETKVSWFFDAPKPTLFDAAVFSYTYLLLAPDPDPDPAPASASTSTSTSASPDEPRRETRVSWGDDTLGRIVRENCPKVVAHARRVIEEYWSDVDGLQIPSSSS